MFWKIVFILFAIWLFFNFFGKRILLYFILRWIKKLEQQTLKDMKHFENKYDAHAKNKFHLNEEFTVIIPENPNGNHKNKLKVIEDVEFEEIYCEEKPKNE